MNELMGEENFVATVIWQKVFSPKNSAKHFSEDHDYIVMYARHGDSWRPELLPRTEEMEARYDNPDNDPRGPWTSGDLSARNYYSEGIYSVTSPSGRLIEGPPPGSYWRVKKEKFLEMERDNRVWWGKGGNGTPRLKRFLSEVKQGRVPQTLWPYSEVGHTQDAKKELLQYVQFENPDNVLDTVKPTALIQRMLQVATNATAGDIILDFFAGSGSTGHAVYKQNASDNGNRKYIVVQLPEPLPKPESKLKNIAHITQTRLRNSGKRIKDEKPMFAGDLGFRLFKLDSTNIRAWDPDRDDIAKSLEESVEHLKADRTEQDILYELLLKLGLDLCVPIETRTIASATVYSIGGGVLIACLASKIVGDDVEALGQGIVAWRKELATAGETTCVFRDSAFVDDVAKTNLAAILEQSGIATVRSL